MQPPARRGPARILTTAGAVTLVAAALSACGGGGGDVLTVYSGRTEELIRPILEDFAEEQNVDIEVKYGDSAELAVLLGEEGDKSPADVFISQSPGAIGYVDGEGLLAPLPDTVTEQVAEELRAADGSWVGLSGRVRTVVYNTENVSESELPESVFDLTGEEYRGRVALAPTNGSFQDFVSTMRVLRGDDETLAWLTAMRENGAQTYENNTAILEAVARGEVDFGLVNHYYNERQLAEDPESPTANHFLGAGDPGAVILTTAAGVLETAGDREDDATALVEFLLSAEAQEYFAGETFEYPLAAGVEPATDLPPLDEIVAPRVDLDELAGGLERTRELIRESGLEQA